MGYSAYTSRYLENDVVSRPREWLVPLLYEHLLAQLRRAQAQIAQRDYEGKAASLDKAAEIIAELMSSLDRERGGELAQRLAALYAYFASEIIGIGRSLDLIRLGRIIGMVATLHEAWAAAARMQAPGTSSYAPAGMAHLHSGGRAAQV